ncbi:unnamed protein product [Kuraishia capsulata CBS 1993]|uniref:Phosphatidylinositol transfer protein SFH5 n=1 Tax=Kuraishia capsulata CBS 1993 TaxID=1382522 RepID=W6MIL3_9ASCO|nr:uncharacterized protein KUCA_T00001728001 [Kuraishia capsulata CBS 1993]CDK25758.1 unnamed protein product [Kuraishia capsulata CBS 1993]
MSAVESESANVTAFLKKLPALIEEAEYDELFGYQLDSKGDFYDENIARILLAKYLKANNGSLSEAETQLLNTLKWRAEFKPLLAAFSETHPTKFSELGVLTVDNAAAADEKIITWNLYGKMDDVKEIFSKEGDKFLRWRVGLMEQAIQLLKFDDPDNDYMVQVHDYKGVSMLRIDPDIRKVTKAIIHTFSSHYPEIMSRKFFVNVPSIMSWCYSVAKTFASPESRKKFMMISNGAGLASELGKTIPSEYGGKAGNLLSKQFVFNDSKSQVSPYAAYIIQQQISNELD